MKSYIIVLSKSLADLPEEQIAGKDRAGRCAMAKELGLAAKQTLITFLESEGLMNQVERIGQPMNLPTLFITCTEDVANRIKQAAIDGIRDIVEDRQHKLIHPMPRVG